jgi:hypothetical protein
MLLVFICCFAIIAACQAQGSKAESNVRALLSSQVEDWNQGDIISFMDGYWRSENLTFIGSNGVTQGWDQTLANYQKGYPDKAAMGHLRFELKDVREQSKKVVSVVGRYILDRKNETLDGYFLLVVKKLKGKWYIVADHSSD